MNLDIKKYHFDKNPKNLNNIYSFLKPFISKDNIIKISNKRFLITVTYYETLENKQLIQTNKIFKLEFHSQSKNAKREDGDTALYFAIFEKALAYIYNIKKNPEHGFKTGNEIINFCISFFKFLRLKEAFLLDASTIYCNDILPTKKELDKLSESEIEEEKFGYSLRYFYLLKHGVSWYESKGFNPTVIAPQFYNYKNNFIVDKDIIKDIIKDIHKINIYSLIKKYPKDIYLKKIKSKYNVEKTMTILDALDFQKIECYFIYNLLKFMNQIPYDSKDEDINIIGVFNFLVEPWNGINITELHIKL